MILYPGWRSFFSSLFCHALFQSRKFCGTFFISAIDFCLQDSCEQNIALVIKQIYAAGVGWLMPEDLRRRYRNAGRTYHYPLVLKYLVDTVTQDGGSRTQEITPWAYKRLEWRAKQGACQNTI